MLKQKVADLELENIALKEQGLTLEERVEHLEELSKIKTLRTCHELAQHGVTTSGWYNLDPDGDLVGKQLRSHIILYLTLSNQLTGKPPVEVYCDFQTGETIIHHSSEETIVADHCNDVGCFKHEIQYSAPMDQIVALSQISEHCKQSI